MSEGNVSQERFESEMRRVDQNIEQILGRIDDKLDAFMARVDLRFERMESRITRIEDRINGLATFMGWTIGLMGLLIIVVPIVIGAFMR